MEDKLDMQSPDLVNENFEKLAALFPNCVTEAENGKVIDFDLLRQELSDQVVEGPKERYRLEWPGKREAIVTANLPTTKTLRPVREDSVDFDNTENLYIEGDNLEVLKLLQESYLGKIKMIYIDPPYNTGKDFVYKDNFKKGAQEELAASGQKDEFNRRLVANPETSGRYHSNWLSMMYPRLKLARNLLTQDGVIFISIDDHEVENLKKLGDTIFGESNFIGQWNWFKSATPPNLSKKIKKNIEYILCYEKQKSSLKYKGIQKSSKSDDPLTKSQNSLKELTFSPGELNIKLKDQEISKGTYGTAKYPNELLSNLVIKNGTNANEVTFRNKFIWVQENLVSELKKGTRVNINSKSLVLSYKKSEYDAEVPPNLINSSVDVDTTESAGKYLQALMGGKKVFSYPKPVSLMQYLLSFLEIENEIVLDFFSGSASTAEAVVNLPNRNKYIMVQIPEKLDPDSVSDPTEKQIIKNGIEFLTALNKPTTLSELGKERIRRAAKKIKEETGADIDYGFRVYRLDSSNMQDVYYKPQDYEQDNLELFADNVKPDRTADDLLAQVMLDWGLPLSLSIEQVEIAGKTVYKVAGDSLYACFDSGIDEDFTKAIAKAAPLRIVFRDSGFKHDTAKVNVRQLLKQLSPDTEMKVL
jgi:adenine-specific DNA-methyltransferase